ncbi:hypothetical protein EON64_14545, partial [archaeon]
MVPIATHEGSQMVDVIAKAVMPRLSLLLSAKRTTTESVSESLPYYCYSCEENYTHNGTTCKLRKEGHKLLAIYKTRGHNGSTRRAANPLGQKKQGSRRHTHNYLGG